MVVFWKEWGLPGLRWLESPDSSEVSKELSSADELEDEVEISAVLGEAVHLDLVGG